MKFDFLHWLRFWWGRVGLIAVLLAVAWFLIGYARTKPGPTVRLRNVEFSVEVAQTPDARAVGLSGRPELSQDDGLLFIHEAPGIHCYWMKDMRISIDILWFDVDRKLIHQERRVSPVSYPKSYCPPEDATYVLEVAAGQAVEHGFERGDVLDISNL